MFEFKASERFWKCFNALSPSDKKQVRAKYLLFKVDPFDKRLGARKIALLSSRYKKIVDGLHIAGDLIVTFYIEGNVVYTLTIGTHDVYK